MFKPLENCLTYSASPKGWLYVKVFEIEAGFPREGGEIVKEESEGYGFAVQFPEQGFRRGLLAKKEFMKLFLSGHTFWEQVFVLSQFLNHAKSGLSIGYFVQATNFFKSENLLLLFMSMAHNLVWDFQTRTMRPTARRTV